MSQQPRELHLGGPSLLSYRAGEANVRLLIYVLFQLDEALRYTPRQQGREDPAARPQWIVGSCV